MSFDAVSYIMGKNAGGGSGGGSTLPAGYTLLSHVVCDGNAYFNSQYESTADFGFHIQYYPITTVSKNVFGGFSLDGTGLVYAINYKTTLDTYYSISDGPIQLSGLSAYRDVTITSNGTTIKAWKDYDTPTEISSTFDTNAVIVVGSFGDTINGVIVPRADEYQGSIKELRFFAGSEVVADFVPCKNPQSVVGMYDTVRGRFFSSEGSSQFGAGNVIP